MLCTAKPPRMLSFVCGKLSTAYTRSAGKYDILSLKVAGGQQVSLKYEEISQITIAEPVILTSTTSTLNLAPRFSTPSLTSMRLDGTLQQFVLVSNYFDTCEFYCCGAQKTT